MSERIQFGERLFLPVLMGPYVRHTDDPVYRRLWVYVLDPASSGVKEPTHCIEVPYEPLGCKGIQGAVFEVDHQPMPQFLIDHLDWPDRLVRDFNDHPLHLDEPRLAMCGGIPPCTGKPLFAGQMAYAVCQRVYDSFTDALGRYPTWAPWVAKRIRNQERTTLKIRPFAFKDANAHYDPVLGTLEFGVFQATNLHAEYVLPGGLVMTTLSHDIIAHEVTHALLDGMRAHFRIHTHLDVPAFHEGFADLVALFHHFRYPSLIEQAIEEHGGLNSATLLALGREFGTALGKGESSCLRYAIEYDLAPEGESTQKTYLLYSDEQPQEPHERGGILVAAIFSAYLQVYERRARELLRMANCAIDGRNHRPLPSELISLLASEAAKVAEDFLAVCIRAIDYCPPLDVRFGDYLRAIITADRMLNPVDSSGMREALIREFRRRRVDLGKVRDLSEYSLEWNSPSPVDRPSVPGLAWSDLRFQNDGKTPHSVGEVERQAGALGEFIDTVLHEGDLMREFGLTPVEGAYGPVTIESLRPVARRSKDGRMLQGMVAEISQTCVLNEGVARGGSTLVLTEEGRVEYSIRKRVDNETRLAAQSANLKKSGGEAEISFQQIHSRLGNLRS